MKKLLVAIFLLSSSGGWCQNLSIRLSRAFKKFQSDTQLRTAISSLYVIDVDKGTVLFDQNSRTGLAPASTQKLITSITGYELLGNTFQFKTEFYFRPKELNKKSGNLYIRGSGDPTLGSWRWKETSEREVINRITNAIIKYGIEEIDSVILDKSGWEDEPFPGGWTWQDIGNYYGAGAGIINWRENQYDLILQSGKSIGDQVIITETNPELHDLIFRSYVTSASKGTGDRTNIYLPLNSNIISIRGSIPVNEKRFIISGSIPSGAKQFVETIKDSLSKRSIILNTVNERTSFDEKLSGHGMADYLFHLEQSPVYDSVVYWFLKKSINLYGESILKTLANNKSHNATTDEGVKVIKNFWRDKGLDTAEISIKDGSGLSPENRVTTHAQVMILRFAWHQSWFNGFYNAFPEYNGMKMKSGTIGGVKGFCGYLFSRNGKKYAFSFLINNYTGFESDVVKKMYKVLDEMKE